MDASAFAAKFQYLFAMAACVAVACYYGRPSFPGGPTRPGARLVTYAALIGGLIAILLDVAVWFEAPGAISYLGPVLALLPAVSIVVWCGRPTRKH
jgi:hypothetical protein